MTIGENLSPEMEKFFQEENFEETKEMKGLWKHQKAALKKLKGKNAGLFFSCGLGKTLTAIRLMEQDEDEEGLCIVITPQCLCTQFAEDIKKGTTQSNTEVFVAKKRITTKKGKKELDSFLGLE